MSNSDNVGSDRSIPAVGQKKLNSDKYFIFIMAAFLVVALSVLWLLSSKSSDDKSLTSKVNDEFDRGRAAQFDVPIVEKKPETVAQEPLPIDYLSAEEKRRLQMEADLIERRKRSPVVVFDEINPAAASQNELSKTAKSLLERQNDIKKRLGQFNNSPFIDVSEDGSGSDKKDSLNSRLSNSDLPGVQARLINHRQQPYIIAQGKVISAILETAIQSDLPGMVRAVVAEDVYSIDGNLKLIEKGSRLVGEYQSGVRRGQARVFVSWNRVITPNGVDVLLDSPGTDALGRSGFSGWVDRHFLERFGASILLSVVGAYSAREAAKDSSLSAQIQDEVGDDFDKLAEIALNDTINIPTTININQGEYIKIFVARDLNFKNAYLLNKRQQNYSYYESSK
jgi:type IV secretion system protein VirB10